MGWLVRIYACVFAVVCAVAWAAVADRVDFDWSPSSGIEHGTTVQFTDRSDTGGASKQWRWLFWDSECQGDLGSGELQLVKHESSSESPSFAFHGAGGHQVTLELKKWDSAGGYWVWVDSKTVTIDVSATAPRCSFTWSPFHPTAGQEVTFTDTSSSHYSCGWCRSRFIIEGADTGATSVKHTFTAPGNYIVSHVVRDCTGRDSVCNETIQVGDVPCGSNQPPTQPTNEVPGLSARDFEDRVTGVWMTGFLAWASSDPEDDALTYDVYFGTTSTPSLAQANATYRGWDACPPLLAYDTTYYWRVVVKDPCHQSGVSSPVWVFQTPAKACNYSVTWSSVPAEGGSVSLSPSKSSYCNGDVVTLTADPSYGWQFAYWQGELDGNTPSHRITMDGDVSVSAHFMRSDMTGPDLRFTCPSPSCMGGKGAGDFSWSASDDKTLSFEIEYRWKLDSGTWSSWSRTKTTAYSGLADGEHTFTLQARDADGNVTERSCTFRVQCAVAQGPNTQPSAQSSPAGAPGLADVSAAVDVQVSKAMRASIKNLLAPTPPEAIEERIDSLPKTLQSQLIELVYKLLAAALGGNASAMATHTVGIRSLLGLSCASTVVAGGIPLYCTQVISIPEKLPTTYIEAARVFAHSAEEAWKAWWPAATGGCDMSLRELYFEASLIAAMRAARAYNALLSWHSSGANVLTLTAAPRVVLPAEAVVIHRTLPGSPMEEFFCCSDDQERLASYESYRSNYLADVSAGELALIGWKTAVRLTADCWNKKGLPGADLSAVTIGFITSIEFYGSPSAYESQGSEGRLHPTAAEALETIDDCGDLEDGRAAAICLGLKLLTVVGAYFTGPQLAAAADGAIGAWYDWLLSLWDKAAADFGTSTP